MNVQALLPAAWSPRAGAVLVAAGSALLAGCAHQAIAPGPTIGDTPVRAGPDQPVLTVFERSAVVFAAALQESALDPSHAAKALTAVRTGRAMLDLQCGRYLDALGTANQSATNERKQVGLIGSFASAVMGLTGSTAKEIAGVATGFGFASSSMDAYTTTYLFSDAATSIRKLVKDAQAAYLGALQGQLGSLDHGDAVAVLSGYEALCRPAQIRALIDAAIARGDVVAEQRDSFAAAAEVVAILAALRAQFGRALSEEEAIVLYAWYKAPAALRGQIEAKFEPVKSLVARDTAPVVEQKLAVAFLPATLAGSPIPARWSAGAAEVAQAAAPPVPPNAPAAAAAAAAEAAAKPYAPAGAPPGAAKLLQLPVLTVR